MGVRCASNRRGGRVLRRCCSQPVAGVATAGPAAVEEPRARLRRAAQGREGRDHADRHRAVLDQRRRRARSPRPTGPKRRPSTSRRALTEKKQNRSACRRGRSSPRRHADEFDGDQRAARRDRARRSRCITSGRGSARCRPRTASSTGRWASRCSAIKKMTGADYALFSWVRDSYASGERIAAMIALAVLRRRRRAGGAADRATRRWSTSNTGPACSGSTGCCARSGRPARSRQGRRDAERAARQAFRSRSEPPRVSCAARLSALPGAAPLLSRALARERRSGRCPTRFTRPDVASDEGGLWAIDGPRGNAPAPQPVRAARRRSCSSYVQDIACRLGGRSLPRHPRATRCARPTSTPRMAPNGHDAGVDAGCCCAWRTKRSSPPCSGMRSATTSRGTRVERLRDAKSACRRRRQLLGAVRRRWVRSAQLGVLGRHVRLLARPRARRRPHRPRSLMRKAGYDRGRGGEGLGQPAARDQGAARREHDAKRAVRDAPGARGAPVDARADWRTRLPGRQRPMPKRGMDDDRGLSCANGSPTK